MDGQPLRYRLTDDGRFVLYSVGLDCIDNGGKILSREQRIRAIRANREVGVFGIAPEADIVWPQPLSPTRPSVSPGSMAKLTPSTAFTNSRTRLNIPCFTGKCTFRFLTSSKGINARQSLLYSSCVPIQVQTKMSGVRK